MCMGVMGMNRVMGGARLLISVENTKISVKFIFTKGTSHPHCSL